MIGSPWLTIGNRGQAIVSTNYWDSDQAGAGLCFLSWNAGAARLLVPRAQEHTVVEMRTAKYVTVSRGPWTDEGGRDALELIFNDDSDSPFFLMMDIAQSDRRLPASSHGASIVFSVWTRGEEQMRLPGEYRLVPGLG
jgi:hypothetical protein